MDLISNALWQIEQSVLDVAYQSQKFDASGLDTLASFLDQQLSNYSDDPHEKQVNFKAGHVNLSFNPTLLDPSIQKAFQDVFGNQIFGNRQDVGDVTLHSDLTTDKDGNPKFSFHLDLYNPKDDLVGLGGHFIFDVLKGTFTGDCLDPAFSEFSQ